ncbi:uncharacterized protein YlxW (UPF0749 family) [Anaerobacterium chartisolvens]|uniref:Uncharacterized protein YlxW (UPF0749 family) n=1 Tax=Anaerobacterium chartisolvens TaxID=1297424 RepID=A0A369AXP4_9FIRM|nr:DUF881 domain-containing protein [Anaerobacterium chartisolvens]RCX13855.1 uncharacterized protein YlxW (UPF0749 family) [Anaerobacterium chartisolvens]
MYRIDKKFIFFLAFLLLGVLVAMQARSVLNINKQKTSAEVRLEQYRVLLEEEKKRTEDLKLQISENEKKKDEYLKGFGDNARQNDYLKYMANEIGRLKLISGLSNVSGRGIVIKLDDAPAREIDNPNFLIIHDQDVYCVVNELKKAGAQAISINGERLIATSEQVCAGPNIRINKNRHPVPYEIKAIGNPELLIAGVEQSPKINEMRNFDIKVQISKSNDIVIEKYSYEISKLITSLEVAKK